MSNIEVNIGRDFNLRTGLRHCSISEYSGELFYHTHLNSNFKKAVENNVKLIVNIDGVRGYSPSFIDESFGNLVYDFGYELVEKHLVIKAEKLKVWVDYIQSQTYPAWKERRERNNRPQKTQVHGDWWRYDNNKFLKESY